MKNGKTIYVMQPINQACQELKESSYYAVRTINYKGNLPHKAILYTGFKKGGYRKLLNASYEEEVSPQDYPDMQVEVLGELELLN